MSCRSSRLLPAMAFCFFLLCRCGCAQTAALTAPASGSDLHGVVQVQAAYTLPPGDRVAGRSGVHLCIIDDTGVRQDVLASPTSAAGAGTATYRWDTSHTKNGNVYLGITIPYTNAQGNLHQATNLGIITVNVQNGYVFTPASCIAAVISPAQTLPLAASGQPFVITARHTAAWTRSDDCQTYCANYRFKLWTTYHEKAPPAGPLSPPVIEDTGAAAFLLPNQLGLCLYSSTETWHSTVTGLTPAQYQNYALTYGQDSNVDATLMQGASNGSTFSVVAP